MDAAVYTETLPNGFSFDMIRVEGGEFDMGGMDEEALDREKPVHRVRLDAFYLGKYLVTQALWKAVMGEENNPAYFKGNQQPIENVSWLDVINLYLPKLNQLTVEERPSGMVYCLPTEAEWEDAARGGPNKCDYRYSGSNKLGEVGWYDKNSYRATKPVGLKHPNELGLYDMSGNVWEWCADWFGDEKYYTYCLNEGIVLNPSGPHRGVRRVVRGGSYFRSALQCRVTFRGRNESNFHNGNLGFRLALAYR